jgi:hypothetical protein
MGVMKILADYGIIDNEINFKRQTVMWISNRIAVSQNSIQVTDLKPGSIIVSFEVIQSPASATIDTTQLEILFVQWKSNNASLIYDGQQYQTELVSYTFSSPSISTAITNTNTTIPPVSSQTTPVTASPNAEHYNFLLLVVLVCVLVPVGLAAIIVVTFIVWKKVHGQPMMKHSGWDVSSDTSMTDDSPKAGFDNPHYVTFEPSKRLSYFETYA